LNDEQPRIDEPRIDELGDGALLVTFGDRIDLELNRRASWLADAVEAARAGGIRLGRPIPAYASVLVPFDPLDVDAAEARAVVTGLAAKSAEADVAGAEAPAAPIEIGVRYGGEAGLDLADVAALHDLRPDDVVELHAGVEYRVFFLGFAPGFAYLGPLPAELATPRLASPRERVPAGSVGIAGQQTAIYPAAMPGGWRLIGRTDTVMWDLARSRPALLGPGDRVRFVPIA
jgi:KipI family sensor histidine kinase inhibitor